MTKTLLEREDNRFSVETATSADKGLQLLAESEIDCIVSDYEMPGMNGIEFLKSVTEDYPNLPFILYTGKGSEEVASDAISAGVTDYLQKKSGTDNYALLTNRIVNAVNSRRREQKIQILQTFENELTELAIDFLRTKERDIDTLIDGTLEKIGTLVDADRTYVFDIHHEDETISNTYEWCAGGVDPQIHMLQDIPQDAVPWWIQKLENFENITVPNVSKLPPEAEAEQEILEEQNIKSLIVTPMISNDELVGFIGFDWVQEQEAWSDEFINILRMVGELIMTARKRKEREQELETLKSQYETLAENFPGGAVFLIDTNLKYVRAGGEELSNVDLSPDDIEGAKPHDLFPDELSDELCHYYKEALDGNANTFEQVYGSDRYRIQTVPVRTDGVEIDHVIAVSQNVTECVEDKQNLQALFESSPDMIDIHTNEGTIVDVNQQFCEAFNQPKDELVGQKVWEIDQNVDPEELQAAWDEMDVGDRTKIETEFETTDGTLFPVEVHLTRLPVEDGSRFMVVSRDITERKQRMEEIETLKERLELAIEGANLGVWDWDMRTDEVEFNDQWAEMLGYTLEELEPHLRTWETRVHPEDIDEVRAALDTHIQQNTDYYDTEHRMRTADGEWKWIRDLGKIVDRDEDGEPIRAVGIHLDIDESKQYQQELEQKTEELEELTTRLEEQYLTLFEEAPVMAVVTRTENGRPIIEDCNNQFAETLGFETEALIGTDLTEYYTPASREALIEDGGYERSLKDEFTRESRELVAADGEIVETVLRAVPRKDPAGAVVGTMAMYLDITEREEVKRANERLEEFASIVSHDLRNPLNVASGHLELAREDCESPDLEAVEQAHDRMDSLIEDLLTLAREGDGATNTKAVDLKAVVAECWETVETAEASLSVETDQTIVADERRLKQLFENLIRNAVEHGGSAVTVTVGGLEDGFYIEDNGPGIPEDDDETVFEVGYSTNSEGTGFGLSIVQQIVEAHDWNIRVTTRSGGGARFEIAGVEFITE
ncbi:PAS domain S-box protein [Natranaeroarchaeum aerophilus]|uniref:histidine kinase n=1 Tax=Natranaeroarchaeum aerophilus TaxID=2917711 RepID=A0AAE3K420_9EURY|nr:PAS domain S-box protein [Natranaeroarchaeum aerophilus]